MLFRLRECESSKFLPPAGIRTSGWDEVEISACTDFFSGRWQVSVVGGLSLFGARLCTSCDEVQPIPELKEEVEPVPDRANRLIQLHVFLGGEEFDDDEGIIILLWGA